MVTDSGESRPLTHRILSGAGWSAVSRIGAQLLSLISVSIVARIISPQAYGLTGMAQVAIGLVALFRDIGISTAVIQRREIDEDFVSSLHWASVILGLAAGGLCWLAAPAAAVFYREPQVVQVLRWLALTFPINSLTAIPGALLSRRMDFRRITVADLTGGVVGLITAVILARRGAGVWALVTATLVNTSTAALLLFLLSGWRPRFLLRWRDIRSMARFGLNLSAFNFVNYFARNADNALIGRYVGAGPLAFYQFSYNLMLYPVQSIAQMLGQVLLPAYAKMQDDHERFRRSYLRACAAIAFLTFPLMAGVTVLARELVLVVVGPKWLPAAAVLSVLAPVGLIQSILTTVGHIYVATGRTDLMFRWSCLFVSLIVLGFIAGLPWGIQGVATAYAIVAFATAIPTARPACRLIHLPLRSLGRALGPGVKCTLAMTAFIVPLRALLVFALPGQPLLTLAVCTVFGAGSYFALMGLLRPPVLEDVLLLGRLLRSQIGQALGHDSPTAAPHQ